jgi:hypothetical protein
MTACADVLASAALPLLVGLEADGFTFAVAGDRLLVRPVERLTVEQRTLLRRERDAILMLLRSCDAGVQARREAFVAQIQAHGAYVPALVFRPDVPYVAGRCFSCGDETGRPAFGRCARCARAWRLALGVAIPSDFATQYDDAKRVA